jgi:hypothetical protein
MDGTESAVAANGAGRLGRKNHAPHGRGGDAYMTAELAAHLDQSGYLDDARQPVAQIRRDRRRQRDAASGGGPTAPNS